MIWLIFAVLTACVILGITRSLRRAPSSEDARDSQIEAYKAQLYELDREEERGTLGREEARQTRDEVSRRLLRASRQSAGASPKKTKVLSAAIAFVAVAAVVSLGSICAYVYYGKPGIPDQPLEARLNAPLGEQTLDVQVANMERRLRQNPADATGWAALASIYFKSGLFEKAADTYQRAIDAGGENESMLLGLTESLTFANDGFISEQAAQALQAALTRNPNSARGRFWSALLAEQDGKKAEAEKIYRDLLAAQIHPTLRNIVTQRLEALSAVADNSTTSEEKKVAGQDAPAERVEEQKMIRGMVERLAARMEKDKSDLEGWLMLIRSYAVLKETDKAKAAMATAREQFASDTSALEQIDAINKELSFAFAGGNAPQPENAAPPQPAVVPLEGEQGKMIRGMVERLAERLKENKSDLEGWLRLIRSYAVLKETDKAKDAAATARQQFASDAKALEEIDALAQGLGLASPERQWRTAEIMTRKRRRAVVIVIGLAMIGLASALVLSALRTQVTFFMSPEEVEKTAPKPGTRFRLGGLVKAGSIHHEADAVTAFTVTDNAASLPVTYRGILPDLFREGQGVVAEGKIGADGVFVADTVLAKHDEKYMPPEVAAALKKNGRWQEQSGQQKTPGT